MKKYLPVLVLLVVAVLSGCFRTAVKGDFETDDVVFRIHESHLEVFAKHEMSGVDIFIPVSIAEESVFTDALISIVKEVEGGSVIALADGKKNFLPGEKLVEITGNFLGLKSSSVETASVLVSSDYEEQVLPPQNGVYVVDTWLYGDGSSSINGSFFISASAISATEPVAGIDLSLSFDQTKIEVTGITLIKEDGAIKALQTFDNTNGKIELAVGYQDGKEILVNTAPVNLYVVNFKTIIGFRGSTNVNIDSAKLVKGELIPLEPTKNGGTIVVGAPKLLGDFNLDYKVDLNDLTEFKPHYRSVNTSPEYGIKYDIGPATKDYPAPWASIYTVAAPDDSIDVVDLVVFSRNYDEQVPEFFVTSEGEFRQAVTSLNGGLAAAPIIFYGDITLTSELELEKITNINLNGYTLVLSGGAFKITTVDAGTMNIYPGYIQRNTSAPVYDLVINASVATVNNYATYK